MFSFFKEKISNIFKVIKSQFGSLFAKASIDQASIKELETILISADAGYATTKYIIDIIQKNYDDKRIQSGADLKSELKQVLNNILKSTPEYSEIGKIFYILVGINGSGKTTFAAKLANKLNAEGKRVLLVAGDTFRAAAAEQLNDWAKKLRIDILLGKENQDPASLAFQACAYLKENKCDVVIFDTAGRLQTKINLMKELEKIKNVIKKNIDTDSINILLTVDSMLGQNSLEQARIFNEATNLNGIILTKLDGSAKGAIVFAIVKELNLPIAYTSFGEKLENMKQFNAEDFVNNLFE